MQDKPLFPIVVTVAGSDSAGAAGMQADLKSISANRAYGASVITALTAQNTLGVFGIYDVQPEFVRDQMDVVFADLDVRAVKIGMLSSARLIRAVAEGLQANKVTKIVLDPVMVATSGDMLLAEEAVETLKEELLPLATLVTPNLHEAATLADTGIAQCEQDMKNQARAILAAGANNVLIKGGHFSGDEVADLLARLQNEKWFRSPRIDTENTHGTGCSLSSAIAANLAHGMELDEAIEKSREWLVGAIEAADELDVGKGAGPVNHFHNYWR